MMSFHCHFLFLSDYNGWPDKLPVDHMTKEHRQLIVEKCSNPEENPNPAMPEVPYLPASTTAPYTAPSHSAMENLVNRFVHQPHMPNLAKLLGMELWSEGMIYMMSLKGLSEAPEGCARFDKGFADEGMYRVLRNITRDEKGNYVDPDLEKNAPLQFALLSIIMENHGFSDVAIQDLVYQT